VNLQSNAARRRGVQPRMTRARLMTSAAAVALGLGVGPAAAQPPVVPGGGASSPSQTPTPGGAEQAPLAPTPLPGAGAVPAPRAPRKAVKAGTRLSVDRVVAVVNDAVILHSEMMRRVAPLSSELENVSDTAERKRRKDKLKSTVLDEMINEELIVQAAAESKVEVAAKEVQNALEEIKKQNSLDDNQLAEALRMQGYSMASYRFDVRRQILRMRAINMLVRPRVTVTDDDVRARFDAQSRRSAAVKRIKLRHIVVGLSERPSEAELATAKKKAADIIEQVRGGADFARLAAAESADESTKYTGGELGWIERGSIDTEWEVIVFGMNKGEVRGPITGPRGLHVFQVTELERNAQKPFAEVKEQLRNEIYRKEMDRQTRLWLEELRDKAHIQVKL
jgi:peptidyl-prolyl cis-trans isomerase SurA